MIVWYIENTRWVTQNRKILGIALPTPFIVQALCVCCFARLPSSSPEQNGRFVAMSAKEKLRSISLCAFATLSYGLWNILAEKWPDVPGGHGREVQMNSAFRHLCGAIFMPRGLLRCQHSGSSCSENRLLFTPRSSLYELYAVSRRRKMGVLWPYLLIFLGKLPSIGRHVQKVVQQHRMTVNRSLWS